MLLKLRLSSILIILSIIFYSCEKELSLEGSAVGGTAVFTFTGAPSACASAVVSGTYQAGVALGATNIVTISVDVTTAGTYTMSTATVNGISFSGAGTFTTTGTQTISLSGTGIPGSAGSFPFSPGTNGCSFSITVTGSVGSTAVFTYGGATGTCTSAVSTGTYTTGTALTAANTVTVAVNVTTIGTYNISTPPVNGFSFSGSGSFAATGPQSVVLTAAGTPTVAGISNFTPSGNGCSFPITVVAGTVVTDYLRCTIDGVAKTFNMDLLGEKISSDTFDISGAETLAGNSPLFALEVSKSPNITTGTYNKYSLTNTSVYCLAAYVDGVTPSPWLTGLSPLSAGFSVVVTSYTANRIEGTFSGTIFSDPVLGTGPKVITAGAFSVPY